MKKYIFIFFILLTITVKSQEHRKYWKDGKLTWNDFQAITDQNNASFLHYNLLYKTDKKEIKNTIYNGVFADAYINKKLSFVKHNLKDKYLLAYNQVLFNILEINKRKLQQLIFNINNINELNSYLVDSNEFLNKQVYNFQKESNEGLSIDVINKWELKTAKELEESSNYFFIDYKKSNWTYGIFLGMDLGMYTGSYKQKFNNTLALAIGFEFSYKNVYLLTNISVTNSKLNNDLTDTNLFLAKGDKTVINNFNASLGYPVYQTEKIKLTPFVGYGITSFGEVSEEKNRQSISTGTSIFGLNLDFKNKKRVNFGPSVFNIREEGNTYIRARIYVGNSNFNPNLKGYSINIGVAYGLEGRLLSKK
ncbi:hypothetical protein [Tenacibaculum salmonis]|uniref:hypothetical protein n=1 Tax=Tenacibaculum sp. P3-BQ1 TaxID=3232310 RepID=UPI0034DE32B7